MSVQRNATGALVMVLSMLSLALADTLVKLAAAFASPAQVLFFIMGGAMISFALLAVARGDRLLDRRAFLPVLLLRYFSEIAGMIGMVMALSLVPISIVGAITQASPILVAAGAVLCLGEKVSWRRWSAIAVGFVGVLLVIQPGGGGFEAAVLWALLAAFALAVRDLTTRLAPADIPSTSLAAFTMVAAVPVAVFWVALNGEPLIPPDVDWLVIMPMIGLGAGGYMLLTLSLRMAEVSVVTPFRYSRIIFLLLIGVLVFGERPNAQVLFGAGMVIASGVYLVWRERQVKRDAENPKPLR